MVDMSANLYSLHLRSFRLSMYTHNKGRCIVRGHQQRMTLLAAYDGDSEHMILVSFPITFCVGL